MFFPFSCVVYFTEKTEVSPDSLDMLHLYGQRVYPVFTGCLQRFDIQADELIGLADGVDAVNDRFEVGIEVSRDWKFDEPSPLHSDETT